MLSLYNMNNILHVKYQKYINKGKFPIGKPLSYKKYCKIYHDHEIETQKPIYKLKQNDLSKNEKKESSSWYRPDTWSNPYNLDILAEFYHLI